MVQIAGRKENRKNIERDNGRDKCTSICKRRAGQHHVVLVLGVQGPGKSYIIHTVQASSLFFWWEGRGNLPEVREGARGREGKWK